MADCFSDSPKDSTQEHSFSVASTRRQSSIFIDSALLPDVFNESQSQPDDTFDTEELHQKPGEGRDGPKVVRSLSLMEMLEQTGEECSPGLSGKVDGSFVKPLIPS